MWLTEKRRYLMKRQVHMLKPSPFIIASAFYLYNGFITHIPVYELRHFYLRHILKFNVDKMAAVHMGCQFTGCHITIGAHTVINRNCILDGRAEIIIGKNVSISPETAIISLTHNPNNPEFITENRPVYIDDYTWIGTRAMILPGAKLGKGCVVGAQSVVSGVIPEYSIYAGSPARKIGDRIKDLRYTLDYRPLFNTDVLC